MQAPQAIPSPLRGRAFTLRAAVEHGLTRRKLQGKRFIQLHRGVYVSVDTELTLRVRIDAARLLLPIDAALSHTTALHWMGVTIRAALPLHFSTNSTSQTGLDGVILHRRLGRLSPTVVDGVPILGPDRSFVDSATILGVVDLIRAGDWLVRLGLTDPDTLSRYAEARHLDGVRRARRASLHVRARVDSVTETDVRLLLRFGRLPEPEVNIDIVDEIGRFLARGDLVYRRFKIVVEYDGWHHERDSRQRQRDHLRRERLESAGWRVIVITIEDLRQPMSIVSRVFDALRQAGYDGPSPTYSTSWHRWFDAA